MGKTILPTYKRIFRLAQCLKVTPGTHGLWLEKYNNKWWLMGGKDGDTPLPQTHNAKTANQALEQAEAWLAPELSKKE